MAIEARHLIPAVIPVAGEKLAALIHPAPSRQAPLIVCCHGLLSSKDSAKFAALGELLRQSGFTAIRFDFTGCGESTTGHLETLIDTRIRDLEAVISYCRRRFPDSAALGLMGSSFGGYVSLLYAVRSRGRVAALACWATPFDLEKIHTGLEAADRRALGLPPDYRVGVPRRLEGLATVSRALIIHGVGDEVVAWRQALEIYRRLSEPRKLLLVEGAEHRFLDGRWRRLAMEQSLRWFREGFATG